MEDFNFEALPNELQIRVLLNSDPRSLMNYLQTGENARQYLDTDYFWLQYLENRYNLDRERIGDDARLIYEYLKNTEWIDAFRSEDIPDSSIDEMIVLLYEDRERFNDFLAWAGKARNDFGSPISIFKKLYNGVRDAEIVYYLIYLNDLATNNRRQKNIYKDFIRKYMARNGGRFVDSRSAFKRANEIFALYRSSKYL